ncbi:MAG TPA: class I SAM-dependent methyltransferase [Bryobacteraceae bacterium]|nr:class I SAM-dependent methyltransferase [Bryobacteraceae bacterium]
MARPPNWYLDPLVAAQKRQVHREWIQNNVPPGSRPGAVLKTDLFEEAYGRDELLFTLPLESSLKIGIDVNAATAAKAADRGRALGCVFANADVRRLPFTDECLDIVLSNSTLDHFETALEIEESLRELARVLKPGGTLLVTLDNPRNPFFAVLRAAMPFAPVPYRLGKTLSMPDLLRILERGGLEPQSTAWLIHNPRFVSTLLFLGLRRVLGDRADRPIRWLLAAFSRLDRWPTRVLTGVFLAVCARKAVYPAGEPTERRAGLAESAIAAE